MRKITPPERMERLRQTWLIATYIKDDAETGRIMHRGSEYYRALDALARRCNEAMEAIEMSESI